MTEVRKPNPITRRETITVETTQQDTFHNLIVTTKAGNTFKVNGEKRAHLFPVFQPGASVIVGYSEYMNKEYVAEANSAGTVVETDKPVQPEKKPESKPHETAPQERGMWWKEVGENFRSGLFKKDEGNGKLLWKAYVAQMLTVLDIKFDKGDG
jgi:hypothetical protein